MRRVAVLGAFATLVFATVSAGAASPPFRYGVAVGEVTSTSAIVWTRAPAPGPVRVVAEADLGCVGTTCEGLAVLVFGPRAARASDQTVQAQLLRLRPGTTYEYSFRQGETRSPVGTFTTAPVPSAGAPVRFAITGDADATPGANGKPAYNAYGVYARMAVERNDFNVNLGDRIYSDSEVGGAPVARTVAQKWAKYRLGLELPALRKLRASAGLFSHWDDHEFVNDFSRTEHGDAIYAAGVKAFRDYSPVTYAPATGLYRTFRWGKHLELFFLDQRSFRSAKATQACGGDLAPTVPQAVRDAFATLAPALRNSVPPACLAALNAHARCSALVSTPRSRRRSGPRRRRGRWSSARCRSSSTTRSPTTAGRATRPSAKGFSASSGRTRRTSSS